MVRDGRSRSPKRERGPDGGGQLSTTTQGSEQKKQKPNYGLSGALAAESKTTQDGTVLKYHEPSEAALPKQKWRIYVYKGKDELDMFLLGKQSAYLFGRDRLVADIPIDHTSCSKQHAVIQFRESRTKNDFGDVRITVKPYLIDLESTNKSYVNGKEVPESRYYEVRSGDTLTFGESTRDYVMLKEDV